jgi:hypothetical protein
MTARPITDTGERRKVLSRIALPNELDAWIRQAFTALMGTVTCRSRGRYPVHLAPDKRSPQEDRHTGFGSRAHPA